MFLFMAVYLTIFGQYKEVYLTSTSEAQAEAYAQANPVHGLDSFQFVRMITSHSPYARRG